MTPDWWLVAKWAAITVQLVLDVVVVLRLVRIESLITQRWTRSPLNRS